MKILIIDDDQDLVMGLAIRLKASGYQVCSAADGLSGVDALREDSPDLVILDLGLPGIDGFAVLDRMRGMTELRKTPVIVLSARDPVLCKKRALSAGATAFFSKPPMNHEFLTAIRQALEQAGGLTATTAM